MEAEFQRKVNDLLRLFPLIDEESAAGMVVMFPDKSVHDWVYELDANIEPDELNGLLFNGIGMSSTI